MEELILLRKKKAGGLGTTSVTCRLSFHFTHLMDANRDRLFLLFLDRDGRGQIVRDLEQRFSAGLAQTCK